MNYSKMNYSYSYNAKGWLVITDETVSWKPKIEIMNESTKKAFQAEMLAWNAKAPNAHEAFQAICDKFVQADLEETVARL